MILLIVESQTKCKRIESFLGSGYKCVASKGHIRDLAKVMLVYQSRIILNQLRCNTYEKICY